MLVAVANSVNIAGRGSDRLGSQCINFERAEGSSQHLPKGSKGSEDEGNEYREIASSSAPSGKHIHLYTELNGILDQ